MGLKPEDIAFDKRLEERLEKRQRAFEDHLAAALARHAGGMRQSMAKDEEADGLDALISEEDKPEWWLNEKRRIFKMLAKEARWLSIVEDRMDRIEERMHAIEQNLQELDDVIRIAAAERCNAKA
jgi:hypothetical protein